MPNSNSVKQKKYLLCLWIWTILLQTTAISRKMFLSCPTLIEVYRRQPFLFMSSRKEFWEDKILIACHTLLLSLLTFSLSWSDCKCYVRTLRNPFNLISRSQCNHLNKMCVFIDKNIMPKLENVLPFIHFIQQ